MASMKKRMLGGAKWTSLSAFIITIIQIAQFAFLGNVMSLKEFGLVGMITTVTIFTQILLDLGIGQRSSKRNKQQNVNYLHYIGSICSLELSYSVYSF